VLVAVVRAENVQLRYINVLFNDNIMEANEKRDNERSEWLPEEQLRAMQEIRSARKEEFKERFHAFLADPESPGINPQVPVRDENGITEHVEVDSQYDLLKMMVYLHGEQYQIEALEELEREREEIGSERDLSEGDIELER
jgi:hypothetical protein